MNFKNYLPLFFFQAAFSINLRNNACSQIDAYHVASISPKCWYNPDLFSNIPNITERHGYTSETFTVTTESGYILELYRIGLRNFDPVKYPVLIIHGIAINPESWVDTGNRSLAFNFVDRGFDTWIGTFRGTMHSNQHVNLTVNDPEYWNFNLDVLAAEDLRLQLTLVANVTNQKVLVLGHSMGTTVSFMYASDHTAEASRVLKGIVALAPIAYLDETVWLQLVSIVGFPLIDIFNVLNIKGLLYQEKCIHNFLKDLCQLFPEGCYSILSAASGKTQQVAPEDILLFFSYWPGGTSIYQLDQFMQIAVKKKFGKYDFGKNRNKEIYGSDRPPLYNLTAIQVPVCLFYGKNDVFYSPKNVLRLYNELGSTKKIKISVPTNADENYNFSHIDFLLSKYVTKFLYKDLFATIYVYFG